MTATHTVHAANMKIGHVRGVHPLPVALTGNPDEDRETVELAIVDAVRRVLPKVTDPVVRWRPSGRMADVWVPMVSPMAKSGRRANIATFVVRPVTR